MNLTELAINQTIDLTNCDREPIHISGRIQPHGVLLAISQLDLTILQASRNTDELLGIAFSELLGSKLETLLNSEQFEAVINALKQASTNFSQHVLTAQIGHRGFVFDAIVHRSNDSLILELERSNAQDAKGFLNHFTAVSTAVSDLQNATSVNDLSDKAARAVRSLTGFDRVMIYRFLEDESGVVIAEARREDVEPFLDLHYPASDIPQQARRLYLLNRLRLIADVNYQPVEIEPPNDPRSNRPLDLSQSTLRSVSPIHIEYLKNMGVVASMSISLIQNEQLWGLIACHHYSPNQVPFDVRNSCELLGQIFSLQIASKEDAEDNEYKLKLNGKLQQLIVSMSKESEFTDGLVKGESNLLDFIDASGAALCVGGNCTLLGQTPTEREIKRLAGWLAENVAEEVFWTDSLPALYPPAEEFKQLASGLLAVSVTRGLRDYVMWFRLETIQTVNWGGDPNKPVETTQDGARLSPRRSFALWQETVRSKSLPWKKSETRAAQNLRQAITEIILSKTERLTRLNFELEQSNNELDSFTFVASHDLKEPLRGIHNFSQFLIDGYADKLDEDGEAKLQTLMRLSKRMERMLDSLMEYSRVNRLELTREKVDLNRVVKEVMELLAAQVQAAQTKISVPRLLPIIEGDPVRIEEIYTNLITNALKYNDKAERTIEIGFIDPARGEAKPEKIRESNERNNSLIFYVRDNGIGIREKHYDQIFRLFRRLHGRDQYGGGTGAGLTIVKRIVERHGGEIWLESIYGEGTTFYFTLQH